MIKLSRRALATVLFTLLALTASLVAAAPATALGGPPVVCNHHTAHRGQQVACVIHHLPMHQHGTVTVTARFWVHKKHLKHRVLGDPRTKVLDRFVTSRHGGRIVDFDTPDHIQKGRHPLLFTVGNVNRTWYLEVV